MVSVSGGITNVASNYDSYLFDFDGTLAETGEGIRRSVAYSLEKRIATANAGKTP